MGNSNNRNVFYDVQCSRDDYSLTYSGVIKFTCDVLQDLGIGKEQIPKLHSLLAEYEAATNVSLIDENNAGQILEAAKNLTRLLRDVKQDIENQLTKSKTPQTIPIVTHFLTKSKQWEPLIGDMTNRSKTFTVITDSNNRPRILGLQDSDTTDDESRAALQRCGRNHALRLIAQHYTYPEKSLTGTIFDQTIQEGDFPFFA